MPNEIEYVPYESEWEGEEIDAGIAHAHYSATHTYPAGAAVIHNGSLWRNISGQPTTGVEPGTDYNVWCWPMSNTNGLINPDFQVAQAGYGGLHGAVAFAADMWKVVGTGLSVSGGSGQLELTFSGSGMIRQIIENYADYAGKTVTISGLFSGVSSNSAVLRVRVNNSWTAATSVRVSSGIVYKTITLPESIQSLYVEVGADDGYAVCHKLKLELCTVSTLSNDAPPNYAEELAKCQRYCVVYGNGTFGGYPQIGYWSILNANGVQITVNLPTAMRDIGATSAIAFSGTFRFVATTGGHNAVNSITNPVVTGVRSYQNVCEINIAVPSGMYAGTAGWLDCIANGANSLVISADL